MSPEELKTFVENCEKKFATRYSEEDKEYKRVLDTVKNGGTAPPTVELRQEHRNDRFDRNRDHNRRDYHDQNRDRSYHRRDDRRDDRNYHQRRY